MLAPLSLTLITTIFFTSIFLSSLELKSQSLQNNFRFSVLTGILIVGNETELGVCGGLITFERANITFERANPKHHNYTRFQYISSSNNMDQNEHGEAAREVGARAQAPRGKNRYQSNLMMAPTNPPTRAFDPSVLIFFPRDQKDGPQYFYIPQLDHLKQRLKNFWAKQRQEIEEGTELRPNSLPLCRIKKIMKVDEEVKMISAEAPVVFRKACELFIMELSMRAWDITEKNKKKTLQKSDIASAITKTDVFDFLVDIVPRHDTMEPGEISGWYLVRVFFVWMVLT
ncbi:Nuclear transcription factor Y subunit C-2, partial [Mucuna pruriens]